MISFSKPRASDLRRSFSSATSSTRVAPRVEALNRDFFSRLIELESDFRTNSYTVEVLDELVQLYARAVEYYDSIQDEISSYFTYKIQDVLATKRSLKMLIDRKEQEKASQSDGVQSPEKTSEPPSKKPKLKELNIDQARFQNSIQEALAEDSSDEEGEKSRREEWEKKKEGKKTARSLASLKSQKQRIAQFYHKVETEKDSYQQDMHVLFSNYTCSSQENDRTVLSSINAQRQKFKRKLEQRKNSSFLVYTLNNTFSNSVGSPCLKGEFNEDSILKELEDSKVFGESVTPLLQKRLKAKSLFLRKEQSSDSKTVEVEIDDGRKKIVDCSTPTEKLSTDNSLTMNEFNIAVSETEGSHKEAAEITA